MLSKILVPALSLLALAACTPTRAPEPAEQATPRAETESATTSPSPAAAAPAAAAPAAAAPAASLTRVADPSTVCMVNDQHMAAAQIPVEVEGRTYYGCCAMCEKRLKQDAQVRLGKDPVSQREVDKASAVIAKDAKGKVWYFENEQNMEAYAARL